MRLGPTAELPGESGTPLKTTKNFPVFQYEHRHFVQRSGLGAVVPALEATRGRWNVRKLIRRKEEPGSNAAERSPPPAPASEILHFTANTPGKETKTSDYIFLPLLL